MSDTKQKGIDDIVHFLIDKGADPNVPNKDDKYPLQHAIELKSIDFVSALIKSNKIDFSRRIKSINNSTFFHLAAISKSSSILNEFIEKKSEIFNEIIQKSGFGMRLFSIRYIPKLKFYFEFIPNI